MEKYFVYMNAQGEVKAYKVVNLVQKDEIYFNAFSIERNRCLTFRNDRVIGEFSSLEEAEEYALNITDDVIKTFQEKITLQAGKLTSPRRTNSSQVKRSGLSCCFTGFKKLDKERLIAFAQKHNIRNVDSISSVTDFLVVCENSKTIGKVKLQKAKQFNVTVLFEDAFYYMLETGIVPEGFSLES